MPESPHGKTRGPFRAIPTEGFERLSRPDMSKILETFPNQYPGREYEVEATCPEFTAVCPRTGQPDFATVRITYVPDRKIIELKSLKLYILSFRDQGIFHEHVTNKILDDLVEACDPLRCEVVGDFNVRGGIKTVVRASYRRDQGRETA